MSSSTNPVATLALLLSVHPDPEGMASMALSITLLLFTMVCLGRFDLADACVRRMEKIAASHANETEFVRLARESAQPLALAARGFYEWSRGAYEEAEPALRTALEFGEGLGVSLGYVYSYLGEVLVERHRVAEAKEIASLLIARAKVAGQAANEGRGHWVLSNALRAESDFTGAETEGRSAADLLKNQPMDLAAPLASLAAALHRQGRHAEALETAEQSIQMQSAVGQFAYRRVFVQVSYAECLHASGKVQEALAQIKSTIEWIHTVASTIDDTAQRRTFVEEVVENRRALELARMWA